LRKTLTGHNNSVWSVSFSPDGQTIATGSSDKTVKLWNRDGTLLKTLTGHNDSVWSVSFSPDGQTIATGSSDKTVKLWNRDGTLLKTLTGHNDSVWSVSFSPDGQTIATGSDDKTVKLWDFDVNQLVAMGCYWLQDFQRQRGGELPICQTSSVQSAIPALLLTQAEGVARQGNYIGAIAFLQKAKQLNSGLVTDSYAANFRQVASRALAQQAQKRATIGRLGELSETLASNTNADNSTFSDRLKSLTPLANSRLTEALWLLERAKKIDPTFDFSGQSAEVKKQWESSIDKLAQEFIARGDGQAREGKQDAAIEQYRYALQINPKLNLNPEAQAGKVQAEAEKRKAEEEAQTQQR
jgi:dipeptidyl aminopeptidase/acylaminoacyl peptidase